MKKAATLLAFAILFAISAYLFFFNTQLRSELAENSKKLGALEKQIENLHTQGGDPEEFELAVYMQRMLTYSNKLWFSGKAGNKALVDFYIHELEESMERIHEADITYEGVKISPLIEQLGLNGIESFEHKMEDNANFEQAYNLLITQCNNCHKSSKHAYIEIKTPETPSFDNQRYRLKD